jgi:tape measure domain-containing protein
MPNPIGDMVVRIVADNAQFNHSIDETQKKFLTLSQTIANSSKNIVSSMKQIDGEISVWGKSTDLIRQKQEVLKNEISNLIAQGVDPLDRSIEKLQNEYYKLGNEAIALDKKQHGLNDSLQAFSSVAIKVGTGLMLGVTAPLVAMGKAAIQSSAEMEMYTSSFEVMLASKSKAEKLTKEVVALAAVTPFNVPEVMDATKMLLQYGVSVNKVLPMVRQLGDASGGMKDKFQSLVLAFSQMQAAGKVLSQDLRQMSTAGFNPLKAISDTTGESMNSLTKRMEQGKVSIEEVNKAMVAVTSEGGRFYQGMEKGSRTVSGLFSTLQDNIGITSRSLVSDYMPAIKNTIISLIDFTKNLTTINPELKTFITTMAIGTALLGPLVLGLGGLSKAILTIRSILTSTMASNPVGWITLIASAVAALTITIIALKKASDTKYIQEGFSNITKELKKSVDEGEKLEDAIKRISKQTGLSISTVIDLANKEKLITEENEKQVTELEKQNIQIGIQKENVKEILKTNDGINKDLTFASDNHLNIQDQIKAISNYWGVTQDRVIGVGISSKDVTSEYKQQLMYIYQQTIAEDNLKKIVFDGAKQTKEQLEERRVKNQLVSEAQEKLDKLSSERLASIKTQRESAEVSYQKEMTETQNVFTAGGIERQAFLEKNISATKDFIYALQAMGFTGDKATNWIGDLDLAKAKDDLLLFNNELKKVNGDQLKEYSELNESLKESADWEKYLLTLKDNEQKKEAELAGYREEWSNRNLTSYDNEIIAINKKAAEFIAAGEDEIEVRKWQAKETEKIQISLAGSIISITSSMIGELKSLYDQNVQNQLSANDTALQAALTSAGVQDDSAIESAQKKLDAAKLALSSEIDETKKAAEQQNIVEAEKALKKAQIEKDYAQKAYEIKLAAFKNDQVFSLAQIAMNTAMAVAKVWGQTGVAGIIAELAPIAMGLTQTAIVLGQAPPSPPALGDGGIVMPKVGGVSATLAERGSPEVVFPLDKLNQFISQGNMRNVTDNSSNMLNLIVNMDGKEILKQIFPATKNGTVLISARAVVA